MNNADYCQYVSILAWLAENDEWAKFDKLSKFF